MIIIVVGFCLFSQHFCIFFFKQVNPQFDSGGVTALMAANILYEMLCVLPGVKYKDNILKYSKDWA